MAFQAGFLSLGSSAVWGQLILYAGVVGHCSVQRPGLLPHLGVKVQACAPVILLHDPRLQRWLQAMAAVFHLQTCCWGRRACLS